MNNTKPIVSVVVPVYNVENYLKKCINSILSQTLSNIEIICVNDGSTDDSLSILNYFVKLDNRIILINKNNGGLSSARNAALSCVRGDYIFFIDSDDYIDSNALENYISRMKDDIDVVIGGAVIEGNPGSEENKKRLENYHTIKTFGKFLIDDDVISSISVVAWGKLYRSSIIKKFNMSFIEGRLYEDVPFVVEYLIHSRSCFFLSEKYYHYIQRNNSLKNTYNFKDYILNFDNLYKRLDLFNLLLNHKKITSKRYLAALKMAHKEVRPDDYDNLKSLVTRLSMSYNKDHFDDIGFISLIQAGRFDEKFPDKVSVSLRMNKQLNQLRNKIKYLTQCYNNISKFRISDYIKYKILSKLTFGNTRRFYREKYIEQKKLYRAIKKGPLLKKI